MRQTKKNRVVCPKAEGFVTMGLKFVKVRVNRCFKLPSLADKYKTVRSKKKNVE